MPEAICVPVDVDEGLERAGGDRAFYRELLEMLLDEAPDLLATIRDGIEDGDAEVVHRAAHTLKGAAANLAAHGVRDASRDLDIASRDGDLDRLPPLASDLARRVDELRVFFETF